MPAAVSLACGSARIASYGDASPPGSGDNGHVSRARDGGGGGAGAGPRLVPATPTAGPAPALLGAGAVLLASAEAIGRAGSTDVAARFAIALLLLALATTLPLVLLGPTGATLAVVPAAAVSLALFHTLTVAGAVATLIALFRLGRNGPSTGPSALSAPLLAVPFVVLALAGPRPFSSEAAVLTLLLAALGPAAGWAGLADRARHEASLDSAAREVIAATLREQTARAERGRIAHELHDVVAHHISMVAVQAETARLTTHGMPAAGAERLSAIGDTARAALAEMRGLLGVLREDADTVVADRRPQPGLGQLNDLLDESRGASGSGTRLIVSGPPVALDPGTELAAYRIVQEALTNVRRHAPGAAVDVELHYTDDALRVRVRDNGPGRPSDPTVGPAMDGLGLAGMRERAAAVGGRLHAGPAGVGGFVVEATLPVDIGVAG
jgi:signal transduction histidine kinase